MLDYAIKMHDSATGNYEVLAMFTGLSDALLYLLEMSKQKGWYGREYKLGHYRVRGNDGTYIEYYID